MRCQLLTIDRKGPTETSRLPSLRVWISGSGIGKVESGFIAEEGVLLLFMLQCSEMFVHV